MVFPVVMYRCEGWTVKKAECQRIDAFELWCWRRLLRVPWTARRSNQSILKDLESPLDCKEIQPVHPKGDQSWVFIGRTDAEAETPVLWPPHVKSWLIGYHSQSSLRLTSIESVMPSSHLILCHPLLLLPSIFPSIRVFSNESVLCIRWPKYWSFSFNICPSNEYSGLISFRIDWFDFLAFQGTLKSLLQHHSSKASILWYSTFFMVQLSHDYMTTGKP